MSLVIYYIQIATMVEYIGFLLVKSDRVQPCRRLADKAEDEGYQV